MALPQGRILAHWKQFKENSMSRLLKRLLFLAATLATGTAMASVTFYEGEGFQGQPLSINRSASDFRAYDYNDRARSMVVHGTPVEVCVDIHYGGGCQVFDPGSYDTLGQWRDTISSVRPAPAQYGRYRDRNYYDRGYYRDDYPRDTRRDNPLNELRSLFGF